MNYRVRQPIPGMTQAFDCNERLLLPGDICCYSSAGSKWSDIFMIYITHTQALKGISCIAIYPGHLSNTYISQLPLAPDNFNYVKKTVKGRRCMFITDRYKHLPAKEALLQYHLGL